MSVVIHTTTIEFLLTDPTGPVGGRLFRTALNVTNRAKRLCPVDTGRLRSSLTWTQPRRRGVNQLVSRVGTNVNYARFVELGTRFMRARPFLRPALAQEIG